jgi:hypothetical protein
MIMQDRITSKERVHNLGLDNNELKLNFYFEKSKRIAKLKRFVKKNIINTQRKDWN